MARGSLQSCQRVRSIQTDGASCDRPRALSSPWQTFRFPPTHTCTLPRHIYGYLAVPGGLCQPGHGDLGASDLSCALSRHRRQERALENDSACIWLCVFDFMHPYRAAGACMGAGQDHHRGRCRRHQRPPGHVARQPRHQGERGDLPPGTQALQHAGQAAAVMLGPWQSCAGTSASGGVCAGRRWFVTTAPLHLAPPQVYPTGGLQYFEDAVSEFLGEQRAAGHTVQAAAIAVAGKRRLARMLMPGVC